MFKKGECCDGTMRSYGKEKRDVEATEEELRVNIRLRWLSSRNFLLLLYTRYFSQTLSSSISDANESVIP